MRILDGWMAARVVRKHTLPHIRQENIAEHTWGVLHILLSIYPEKPPPRILIGAIYHDMGEYRSGDIPGDFKADNPEVKKHTEMYELAAAKEVVPDAHHDLLDLTPAEVMVIKLADKLEFAFSCYHEWMLGNRYSLAPMERTIEMARKVANSESFAFAVGDIVLTNAFKAIDEAQRLLETMRHDVMPRKEIEFAS